MNKKGKHNIYVIELDKAVLKKKNFLRLTLTLMARNRVSMLA